MILVAAGTRSLRSALCGRPSRRASAYRHDRRARCSSRATRTRRTRSASAAPTSGGRCSSTGRRASPTAGSPSWRGHSKAPGRTSSSSRARTGSHDPLDPRVVEAYWVGNELLDRVEPGRSSRHVDDRFRGRLGRAHENVVDAVAAGAVPHHCFHVFAVYPWLGLLRTGIVDEPLRILDQCRTTPARVVSVDGETVTGARPAAPL